MSHKIHYEFDFDEQKNVAYDVIIDENTLALKSLQKQSSPEWTKLAFNQCEGCSLSINEHEFCPLAVNISDVIERFSNVDSHIDCTTKVTTEDRISIRETSVQDGLYSLLGLVMAVSECPEMTVFRPMARFHLPFSSAEETIVRTTSMYMLKQYFEHKHGRKPDLDLEKLHEQYRRIEQVNQGIINRIRDITKSDSNKNALVILNSWAQMLSVEIEDNLFSVEHFFYTDLTPEEAERFAKERSKKLAKKAPLELSLVPLDEEEDPSKKKAEFF